jgi:hypothetical protein
MIAKKPGRGKPAKGWNPESKKWEYSKKEGKK